MDEHCRGCIRYLKSCSGLSKAVCEKHQLRIPRTNADKIRAMSDEELAEFVSGVEAEAIRRAGLFITTGDIKRGKDGWLDWLKQEGE